MKRLVAAAAIVVAILGGGARSASARDWVHCANEGGSAVLAPAPSSTTVGGARLPTVVARPAAFPATMRCSAILSSASPRYASCPGTDP